MPFGFGKGKKAKAISNTRSSAAGAPQEQPPAPAPAPSSLSLSLLPTTAQVITKIVGNTKHVTTTRVDERGRHMKETKITDLTPQERQQLGGTTSTSTGSSSNGNGNGSGGSGSGSGSGGGGGGGTGNSNSNSNSNSTKTNGSHGASSSRKKVPSPPQRQQHQQQHQQQAKEYAPAPSMKKAPPPQSRPAEPTISMMKTPSSPISKDTRPPSTKTTTTVHNITVGNEQVATIEVTRELVKQFIADIWNRGEIDLIPKVCHPSLRFNGHVGMDRVGHEGFSRMVTTVREALTDYHCEIHSMVVESNKAFCRLRFTGKHTGTLLGYPPTGQAVAWMGASEFTCKNGKILKVWELGDVKSLDEQLRSID